MVTKWSVKTRDKRKGRSILALLLVFVMAVGVLPTNLIPTVGVAKASSGSEKYLDKIVFGNAESEAMHNFSGDDSEIVPASEGLVGQSARRPIPSEKSVGASGDLTFRMKVDPYKQNYITVKYSGSDINGATNMILIDGEKVEHQHASDINAICGGYSSPLPDRFYYCTGILPLTSTYGKESVEVTIATYSGKDNKGNEKYNAYTHTDSYLDVSDEMQGSAKTFANGEVEVLAGNTTLSALEKYSENQKKKYMELSDRVDAMQALTGNRTLSITRYVDELKAYANYVSNGIIVVRDENGVEIMNPTKEQIVEEKKKALQRIFKVIDTYVVQYYGNTKNVGRAYNTSGIDTGGNGYGTGHQSDWGGYYHPLGEALFIVSDVIDEVFGENRTGYKEFLQEQLVTGTIDGEYSLSGLDANGNPITRFTGWERCFKATYDFARTRLSYIYNQIYYTYIGAWCALEGLGQIGSPIYEEEGGESKAQYILEASLGCGNWYGEEVVIKADGSDLNLYHDLFKHDSKLTVTDDVYQYVMKGLAVSKRDKDGNQVYRYPYGTHFTGISMDGLTRENEYTGDYGEAANYLVQYFYMIAEKKGYEKVADDVLKLALKNIHARSYTRFNSIDGDSNRTMRMEQVVESRHQAYPGKIAYAAYPNQLLQFVSLEWYMANHKEQYKGADWENYWDYANEAVGFFRQASADGRITLNPDAHDLLTRNLYLEETFEYVNCIGDALTEGKTRADLLGTEIEGKLHPFTNMDYYTDSELASLLNVSGNDTLSFEAAKNTYNQFAWIDKDVLYVAVRDGDTQILGSLNLMNKGMVGNGLLHVIYPDSERIVQIKTNNQFIYNDYYVRHTNTTRDFTIVDENIETIALAGEVIPVAYQPGIGTTNRENYESDTPYAGYADLTTGRYGNYFMVVNTTRDEYENKQIFNVELPTDFTGNQVLDLVSGNYINVVNGNFKAEPLTAYVLKLDSANPSTILPGHVDYVKTLAGTDETGNPYAMISWKLTSAATAFEISRSRYENGGYTNIATVTADEILARKGTAEGNHYYIDATIAADTTYYYKVTAVNSVGKGWTSYRSELTWDSKATGTENPQKPVYPDNGSEPGSGSGSGSTEENLDDENYIEVKVNKDDAMGTSSIFVAVKDTKVNELIKKNLNTKENPMKLEIIIPEMETVKEIENNTTNCVNVSVQISRAVLNNEAVELQTILASKNILQAAAKNKKSILVTVQDENKDAYYSWYFDATEISRVMNNINDVNLCLEFISGKDETTAASILKKDKKNSDAIIICAKEEQQLPYEVNIKISIGRLKEVYTYKKSTVYVYHMNTNTNKWYSLPNTKQIISKDQVLTMEFNNISNYAILQSKADSKAKVTLKQQIKMPSKKTVEVGKTTTLTLDYIFTLSQVTKYTKITSKSKMEAKVTYATSNKKIVTVGKAGTLTGKKEGKATITATVELKDGTRVICKTSVTVKKTKTVATTASIIKLSTPVSEDSHISAFSLVTQEAKKGQSAIMAGNTCTKDSTTDVGAAGWSFSNIGITSADFTAETNAVSIQNANGNGLAYGNDENIFERDINDTFAFANTIQNNSFTISAKIDSYAGSMSGLMIRDLRASSSRYIYFGADDNGNYVLRNRTRDSRTNVSTYEQVSPLIANTPIYSVADYPYAMLSRDYDTHYITGFVSKDGGNWIAVDSMATPMPPALYAGIATDKSVVINEWKAIDSTYFLGAYPVTDIRVSYARNLDSLLDDTKGFEIRVNWTSTLNAVKYSLLRSEDGITYHVLQENIKSAGIVTDNDVVYGKTYYYRVDAYDKDSNVTEGVVSNPYTLQLEEGMIDVLLNAVQIDAGSKAWGSDGTGITGQYELGKLCFDGKNDTWADTQNSKSLKVDFGEGKGVDLTKIRVQAVASSSSNVKRLNDAFFQASNDGVNWINLTRKVTDVEVANQWIELAVNEDCLNEIYRYIRITNESDWYCNVAEIQLYGNYYETIPTADHINLITISSNNEMDATEAKVGDTVTLQFTSNEEITGIKVRLNGEVVQAVSSDNKNWTAEYVIGEEYNIGEVIFTIGYRDLLGNVGITRATTTDGTKVSIIKTYKEGELDIVSKASRIYTEKGTWTSNGPLDDADTLYQKCFDVNKETYSDAVSRWMRFDFDNEDTQGAAINRIRLLSINNSGSYSRLNGAYLEGSNDGTSWITLTDVARVIGPNEWAELEVYESLKDTPFKYIRINNKNSWMCNMAEIEFYGTLQEIIPAEGLSLVSITSSNINDSTIVRPGDTIQLSFTSNGALSNVVAKVMGNTVTVTTTDNITYTGEYIIDPNVVFTTISPATLIENVEIYIQYTNQEGRTGVVTTTTDGSSIRTRNIIDEGEIDIYDMWRRNEVILDASNSKGWGGNGYPSGNAATNSSYLFDGIELSYPNIETEKAWFTADFGEGKSVNLTGIKVQSNDNTTNYVRANGVYVLGSNDGTTWIPITSHVEGANSILQWIDLGVTDTTNGYRYLKITNDEKWYGNISSIKFYGQIN